MQISTLLSITSSLPSGIATPGSGAAFDPAAALSVNGVQNTGSLADALLTAQTASPAQFAGLLSGQTAKTASDALITDKDTKAVDATAPTTSIAVPPIGLYIDQQPNQNVVLTPVTNTEGTINANGSKKLVFASDLEKASQPASGTAAPIVPQAVNNAPLANEVYNEDQAPLAKAAQPQGKIKLSNLEASAPDEDFHKAFANIIDQARNKVATADTATETPVKNQIQGKVVATQTDKVNEKSASEVKVAATETLAQPQQVASKIAAKVIGIKQDKISLESDTTSAEMSAKLDSFAAHLQNKNYAQIKETAATLPQTAADQVQVKISQAIASGENSIKINLHPAELGAVDVSMDTDKDGKTSIRIIADKAETLQMLQHDSKHLVKSLSDIGVKADANNLQFSLRGDQQQQNFAQNQNNSNFGNNQPNQQQANAATATYSRFSNINEQDLILSVNNKALNILV